MIRPVHALTSPPDFPGLLPNRACRPCVNIKAKCIPLTDSEDKTCERCHRLGKDCTTPQPKSRKRAVDHTSSVNGSGRLGNTNVSPVIPPPQFHPSPVAHSESLEPSPYLPLSGSYPVEAIPIPPTSNREPVYNPDKVTNTVTVTEALNAQDAFFKGRSKTAGTAFDVSPEIGHSFIQPVHEKLFEHFCDQLSPYFPFVTMTNNPTKMRQERPFTYAACVMAAAHRDPTLQYRISRDMLRYLGEHILLLGEKSLDVLQGLLIMMNWYHVYTHHNPQLMNLLHLAQALLVDLGLNRPPGTGLFQIRPSNDAARMLHGQQPDSHHHNLEERRTCLGVYHIQAKLTACFRRLDAMCWSEHLEECCQLLHENTERPTDAHAVAFVRLDRLVDRYRNIDDGQQKLTMPLQVYIKLFSTDLERFKQNLPSCILQDPAMSAHVQTARICLFERIINSDTGAPSHKVEALHACLAGVVEYFNSFSSLEVESMPHLPFLAWSTIAHAFDIYAKLSFAEVENWDLGYVRNNPGFIAISDGIIRKLNDAQSNETIHHPDSKSTRFKISVNRLEMFKLWYLQRIDLESRAQSERLDREAESSATIPDPNSTSYFSDFADVVWQDFTADWAAFDSTFNLTT